MENKTPVVIIGDVLKLTNTFSTKFVIETADGKSRYKQVFTNNMSNKGDLETLKCKASDNWTKVSFEPDLAKFNMSLLEDDVVALMKKRVVDLAGCLSACYGKKVQVLLNGKEIVVKSFHGYAQLYLNSAYENEEVPLPRIDNNSKEDINPRWQISVSRSGGQFQQVSFVNNINTINGGNHVDYITAQITKFIIDFVKKKNKNANLTPQIVENHLWIFVNAVIDHPVFARGKLVTPANMFGSTCDLSNKFLKKVVDSSGVVEYLVSWAKVMQKTGGAKIRLCDIPELEDATKAGGISSHECTLILTEGESAKAFALSGLPTIGRAIYGVFPLKGKPLNVKQASKEKISGNVEINKLITIMGLKKSRSYDTEESLNSLRYGRMMIMADSDYDGSHIKGLVINFIHTFWPSLLKQPFLLQFSTPIRKAVCLKNTTKMLFYSIPEYNEWNKDTGADVKNWQLTFYKGLASFDSDERTEYFSNFKEHVKYFRWLDEKDDAAIDLVFSKEKADARKEWIEKEENGRLYLDPAKKIIKLADFFYKELKGYSIATVKRSFPSLVDGLKCTQRKVLYSGFKRNLVNKINVAEFSGHVSADSSYHHALTSIQNVIIGMAQKFVGSNNVNLLEPHGEFGSRYRGGDAAGYPRYLKTSLADVARSIFLEGDDVLLDYLEEDGLQVEPACYMPIIPMVLVNGAKGIATGWNTTIPNYNPRKLIDNIRRLLRGDEVMQMDPWYKNFNGTFKREVSKDLTYTVNGKIDVVGSVEGDDVTLLISELPLQQDIRAYQKFLDELKEEGFIKEYENTSTDEVPGFKISLSKSKYNQVKHKSLMNKFRLTKPMTISNMNVLNKDGKLVKFDNPEKILKEYFHLMMDFYKRKAQKRDREIDKTNQVDFRLAIEAGDKYLEYLESSQEVQEMAVTLLNESESIPLMSEQLVAKELGECSKTVESLSDYDQFEAVSLWLKDLEKLEKALDEKDRSEAEKASANASVSVSEDAT